MIVALVWLAVVMMLALWSLAAWGVHAAGVWAVSNAGATSGVGTLRLPEWLAVWVPEELVRLLGAMLADLAPLIDGLLQSAPLLASGLTLAMWIVWGLGALMLVAIGAALHGLVALVRRKGGGSGPPALAPR